MTYVIYKQDNKWYVESSNGVSIEKSEHNSIMEALNSILYLIQPLMLYVIIPPCEDYVVTPLLDSKEATYANSKQISMDTPSLLKMLEGRLIS